MAHAGKLLALLVSLFTLVGCAEENAEYIGPNGDSACAARVIKDEYLVQFKDARGVQRMTLDQRTVQELLRSKVVAWVEPNYSVTNPIVDQRILRSSLRNPNAFVIGADYAWRRGFRGQGVLISVVDSGIDKRHPLLSSAVVDGWNFLENRPEVVDETGHGTHIAGIIASARVGSIDFTGIAPSAKLLAADFMDADRGDEFNAIRAVEWSIQRGAKIINNSWSNFCSYSIRRSFLSWQDLNVIFVNAAGNDGLRIDTLSIFPSNLDLANAVTVGSVGSMGARSSFSNYGRNVYIYAPGEEIYSLSTSDFSTELLVPLSGTSMSTAYVSGALALVWSARPDLNASQIVRHLKGNSHAAQANGRNPMMDVRRLLRSLRSE